jgi:hypothetical protein
MDPTKIFIEVVRASQDLPADVRSQVGEARAIEESSFDESYIQFLDEQIRLSPRGPQWAERLKRRRAALYAFCGMPLISGHIRSGGLDTWVKVDPKTREVIHWEQYNYDQVL